MNRLSMAAKLGKTLGELCEAEHDIQGAIEAYSEAADCYLAEDSTAYVHLSLLLLLLRWGRTDGW